MKPVTLSRRLQGVVSMVTCGNRVCDVGCDHGFVSIYLIEQRISPSVLAMDVRPGPLGAAREHIAEHGLADVIETRLSDGLHNYNTGEADTLICAGMGGSLMMRILCEDIEKALSFRELVLQPQSEVEAFRRSLRGLGYCIVEENMIEEDGKFYPMMRGIAGGGVRMDVSSVRPVDETVPSEVNEIEVCKLNDRYGELLLQRKDKTLAAYLRREEKIFEEILDNLRRQGLADEKRMCRYEQVSELLEDCRKALAMVGNRPCRG